MKSGDLDALDKALQSNPSLSNTEDDDGVSLLHWAALKGHSSIVSLLLTKSGTLVNDQTKANITALHCAALANEPDIIRILIERGADVSFQSSDGTPLHYAVENRSLQAVQALLEMGADPEERNRSRNESSIELARRFGFSEIVQDFQKRGQLTKRALPQK